MSQENRRKPSRRVYTIVLAVSLLCLMHTGLFFKLPGGWKFLVIIPWLVGMFGTLAVGELRSNKWLPPVTFFGGTISLIIVSALGAPTAWFTLFGEKPTGCVVVDREYNYSRTSASTYDYLITCGDRQYEYNRTTGGKDVGERVDLVVDRTGLLEPEFAKVVSATDVWWYVGGIAAVALFIMAVLTVPERKPWQRKRKPATVHNDFI